MSRYALAYVFAVIAWLAAATANEGSFAQQSSSLRRIGVVAPGFSANSEEAHAFREGLQAAGYVEGRDLSVEWWYGHGNYSGVADAIAKFVRSKADVIVVESTVAALAAKRATQTIPIVMALVGDPVAAGVISKLGQPGGNITGLTNMTTQLMAKRLQLLKEAVPSARRVGVIWNPDTPIHTIALDYLRPVATQLHVDLVPVAVNKADQFDSALSTLTRSKVDAVMILDDAFMSEHAPTVVRLATRARLPVAYGWKAFAKEGVLISYATQGTELFRRAAGYVDKILKGASPASLPVEQPTKFELVINLRTAKALGITVPESVLLQADELLR